MMIVRRIRGIETDRAAVSHSISQPLGLDSRLGSPEMHSDSLGDCWLMSYRYFTLHFLFEYLER